MPKISVIVCTYKRMDFLPKALESLVKQSLAFKDYEIIIINNNSPDNTEEYCLAFKQNNPEHSIYYTLEKEQGLSYARNRGIILAKGEILCFIDDDAIANSHYLEELVNFFEKHLDAVAVGGHIYPLFETERPKWMSSYLLDITSSIDLGKSIRKFPTTKYPIGANMAFRAFIFSQIGLFNVNLGRKGDNLEGAEEKEIFKKIRKEKQNIYYLPSAIVAHYVPAKRLSKAFFIRLATSIGYSEKIRTKNISAFTYFKRILLEIYKWVGTLALLLGYTLCLKPNMGIKLVEYRWYISMGLLGISEPA
ncbi:MAG: glycosyltransferase [Bacteroidales bacterium]